MLVKLTALSALTLGCALSVLTIAGANEAPHREIGLSAAEAGSAAATLATHVPSPLPCAAQTWPYIAPDCVTPSAAGTPAAKSPRTVRTIAIR